MNIIATIWKQFKTLIIFLLLEAIAISMLLSFNPYQNAYFFQTTTAIRFNFFHTFSLIDNYLNLDSENRLLLDENAKLSERLRNQQALGLGLSEENLGQYHYIPAKVAYSSIGMPDNYLVINQGSNQGVAPEMAVISSNGLVGVVYAASNSYALVMPTINTSFSCLVALGNKTLSANTSWDGKDYRFIDVKGVPLHLTIEKGDSVFTNNNSTLYPEHELIGTVTAIEKEDLGKSFALKVKLSTDFSSLRNVYVIENNHKKEIDSLLQYE